MEGLIKVFLDCSGMANGMNSPSFCSAGTRVQTEGILLSFLLVLMHSSYSIVPQGRTDPIHNILIFNSHLQHGFIKKKLHFLEMHILPCPQILCPNLAPVGQLPNTTAEASE